MQSIKIRLKCNELSFFVTKSFSASAITDNPSPTFNSPVTFQQKIHLEYRTKTCYNSDSNQHGGG